MQDAVIAAAAPTRHLIAGRDNVIDGKAFNIGALNPFLPKPEQD
jgi:hypothetical protein